MFFILHILIIIYISERIKVKYVGIFEDTVTD